MMEIKVNNNNTNMDSEDNLNDNLQNNIFANGGSNVVGTGLMEENGKEILSDNASDTVYDWTYGNDGSISDAGNEGSLDTENADVSDGNAAHMEGNAAIESDISGNDLYPPAVSVSGGDIYIEYYGVLSCSCGDGSASPFMEEDVTHINNTLDMLLFTADGILFFILFAWAEKKISNGIRKLFHKITPNT